MSQTTAREQSGRLQVLMQRYLGENVMQAFASDDVTEIYVNPQDNQLRLDTRSQGKVAAKTKLSEARIEQFLHAVATLHKVSLGRERPVLQAELPRPHFKQARLQGFLPPVTTGACFVIRKRAAAVYDLYDYVKDGIMSLQQWEAVTCAVNRRLNILVCGGTGSGKTTLCNAILKEITRSHPNQRLVILEDTLELQCVAADHLQLQTSERFDMADLVKYTLRCAPDRIIIGEVRDAAALHMLDAWATGHPGGCCTVHATTTPGALHRLERLIQRAGVTGQKQLVAETVDLVVLMEGGNAGRTVSEMAYVNGLDQHGRFDLRPHQKITS